MTSEERNMLYIDQMTAADPRAYQPAQEAAEQRRRYSEPTEIERGNTEEKSSSSTSSSTTTSSSITTHPGVFCADIDFDYIREIYNDVLGRLTIFQARFIEQCIQDGQLETSAVIDALEQTSYAPRPSFPYFRAVLSRYVAEGIHNSQKAAQQRWTRAIKRASRNQEKEARWYQEPED